MIEDLESAWETITLLQEYNERLMKSLREVKIQLKENQKAFDSLYNNGFIPYTKKYITEIQKN